MCTPYRCYRLRGVEKLVRRYVLTKWIAQTNVTKHFLCTSTSKYSRASSPARKMSKFSSITITIIFSYAIIRIQSPSSIFESPQKKQASNFLKRNSYTNACLKPLCDAKLITLLVFKFLVNFEVKPTFPCRYILELFTLEYGCLVGLNILERTRQRVGALMSNHCLTSR